LEESYGFYLNMLVTVKTYVHGAEPVCPENLIVMHCLSWNQKVNYSVLIACH
jgi:hypothetical protein